jgi:hypothetical protein
VVARRIADILQIVMLTAGAHAFLRGGGALIRPRLRPGKDILKLHHAGVCEQQGGIVARHQGRRADDFMAVTGKEIEEG